MTDKHAKLISKIPMKFLNQAISEASIYCKVKGVSIQSALSRVVGKIRSAQKNGVDPTFPYSQAVKDFEAETKENRGF